MNIIPYDDQHVIVVGPDGRMFTAKLVPNARLTIITKGTLKIPEFDELDVKLRVSRISPQGAESALRAMLAAPPEPERMH